MSLGNNSKLFVDPSDVKEMKSIEVSIYADESRSTELEMDFADKENWMYIGILIVPETIKEALLDELKSNRCKNKNTWDKCPHFKCLYHDKNNKEVHFDKLISKDDYYIADRWIDFFMNDRAKTHFYILGINTKEIDRSYFGALKGQDDTIYNRFFRTAISKSLRYYFSDYDKIVVNHICHDNSDSLKTHEHFPWHSIFKIENDISEDKLPITFKCREITFVDSDHRISGSDESHFIQYIDLLLGAVRLCFHGNVKNDNKNLIALKTIPIVKRIADESSWRNPNSRFCYHKRCSIDFFPKQKLSAEDNFLYKESKRLNCFYKNRPILIDDDKQPRLF
ncbi:MAG TPA: hypothetical protein DET40_00320 [Lentisphaeria bacterium]|nr:MAG: hypothetical protein A2X45_10765 [Lentisphaerae bacterium GWF2_50_93]HCE41977.1 hypothetical protein [Lentisphaeria bacterium]